MKPQASQLLLGLDGGATKTAGVIIDCQAHVLAHVLGPAATIVGRPTAEPCSILASIVDDLCTEAHVNRDAIVGCGIGLNGVDFADEVPMQRMDIATAIGIPEEHVVLVNDAIVGLWGATSAPAAALVQHGSGFTAAYRARHGEEELFDHLSVARIFDVRSGLISMVARMINGMVETTALKDKTLAFFAIDDEGLFCETVYRDLIPWQRRRGTVPLVFQAWSEGDVAAAALVERALQDYTLAARAMISKTGSSCPDVRFGGGLVAAWPDRFWGLLIECIQESHPDIVARPRDLPPEFGGALMAAHHLGIDPVELFRRLSASEKEAHA